MNAKNNPAPHPITRQVRFERVLDAPRALVWKAWTDPRHLAQWWGPHGFTNPVCKLAVRPGGSLRIVMRAPYGVDYPMTGVFHEVEKPGRLAFLSVAWDENGGALLTSLATATFAAQGAKTKLTVLATAIGLVPVAKPMLGGMKVGWSQSLERLAELVKTR
ncbi:MAG TPA: SRPBCC domain-containing protein [Opitutales bacterium]|nr:SRPBCC domain-containing protein [Opitutales bacterium]